MAMVYRGVDTRLDREVALKFVGSAAASDEARDRLRTEARAAASLDHPNIGRVYTLEETADGEMFIVMAYYRGHTLEDRLLRGPLSWHSALDIALQTAAGLEHAHRAGIVHRDIKPGNLLLGDDERLKILDFGLAQLKQPEAIGEEGLLLGTMAYMSPEQAHGRSVGPRSDLWSLGVVLYEALAGVSPFEGDGHIASTLLRIFSHHPPPLSELRPELPQQIDALLSKLLAKEPELRYDSAGALAADLTALQKSEPTAVPSAATPTVRNNLPPLRSPLIGRSDELQIVTLQLGETDCRVLTLLGPGGSGKTHLGLAAGHRYLRLGTFPDGVFLVDLEALSDPGLLASRISEAVELPLQGESDPLDQIVNHFARRKALLILDNFEQAMEGADIVSELARRLPNLKILAASRERLGIDEEWIVPLQGLRVPESSIESPHALVSHYGALELFQRRAQRALPGFAIDFEMLPSVIEICKLTMGLPLGIELAAAWVHTMTPAAIAEEIAQNRDFLASSNSAVPERHRSIRSVFFHSWQRLGPDKQEALLKLSVFRGGFSETAALAVAEADPNLLAGLVDASLLNLGPNGRYQQHTLLRQYAEERLAERPQALHRVRRRHGHHFVELLTEQGQRLRGPEQGRALAAIELELGNIRSAWDWALANAEFSLLGQASEPFRLFHDQRGLILEGLEQFTRATEALPASEEAAATRGRLLVDRAWLALRTGRSSTAMELAERGVALLRPHGDFRSVVLGLNAFGAAAARRGRHSDALPLFDEALALAQQISDPNLEALSLDNMASAHQTQGHTDEAERFYRNSLEVSRRAGDDAQVALNLNNLGSLVLNARGPAEAAALFAEGLQLARTLGLHRTIPFLLANLGLVAFQLGKFDHARTRFLEAIELVQRGGEAWLAPGLLIQLGRTAAAEQKPEEAARNLQQALKTAWEMQDLPLVLEALARLVEVRWDGLDAERIPEALSLILVHPASQQRDRALASSLAQGLHLPPPPPPDQLDARLAATVQGALGPSST